MHLNISIYNKNNKAKKVDIKKNPDKIIYGCNGRKIA